MDSDASCLVTMVLDTQAFAHQVQPIEHLVPERLARLVAGAERLLHRYGIADPAFGAYDAVQDALLKVFQSLKDGKIDSLETEVDLLKLLRHKLNQKVLDGREREHARKRGGSGADHDGRPPAFHHMDVDLETIDSRHCAPEAQVNAEDQVEWLLALLDLHDPRLRAVATMKAEGFTHKEIGAHLDEPLSAVDYRVRLIKAIFGRLYPELICKKYKKVSGFQGDFPLLDIEGVEFR